MNENATIPMAMTITSPLTLAHMHENATAEPVIGRANALQFSLSNCQLKAMATAHAQT